MSALLRFWAYGLMLSPVKLGRLEFGSKIDEAEAGKVVRRSTRDQRVRQGNLYASGRSEKILERPRAVGNHVAMAGRAAGPLRTGARASPQSRLSWLSEH
jgi:hypothetical protein